MVAKRNITKYWERRMINHPIKNFLIGVLLSITSTLSVAGPLDDINCGLNSLLGGNCPEISRINKYQEQRQSEWMSGRISATEMVQSIIEFHKSLTPIDSYNRELYSYSLQVARVCDSGKITKDEGLYLMTRKENEINERIQARLPPPTQQLICTSESFGGRITTRCN